MNEEAIAAEITVTADRLRALRRLLRTYRRGPVRPRSPAKMAAVDLAAAMLVEKTSPTPTKDIVARAAAEGIVIGGLDPINTLSAALSQSGRFRAHGRRGWTLRA